MSNAVTAQVKRQLECCDIHDSSSCCWGSRDFGISLLLAHQLSHVAKLLHFCEAERHQTPAQKLTTYCIFVHLASWTQLWSIRRRRPLHAGGLPRQFRFLLEQITRIAIECRRAPSLPSLRYRYRYFGVCRWCQPWSIALSLAAARLIHGKVALPQSVSTRYALRL